MKKVDSEKTFANRFKAPYNSKQRRSKPELDILLGTSCRLLGKIDDAAAMLKLKQMSNTGRIYCVLLSYEIRADS